MEDMMKMYRMANDDGGDFSFPLDTTLILNTNAPLVQRLEKLQESDSTKASELAAHIYYLALLSHRKLTADEMQRFLGDSYKLLLDLSNQ